MNEDNYDKEEMTRALKSDLIKLFNKDLLGYGEGILGYFDDIGKCLLGMLAIQMSSFSYNVLELFYVNVVKEYRFKNIPNYLFQYYLSSVPVEKSFYKPYKIILECKKPKSLYYESLGFKIVSSYENYFIMIKNL